MIRNRKRDPAGAIVLEEEYCVPALSWAATEGLKILPDGPEAAWVDRASVRQALEKTHAAAAASRSKGKVKVRYTQCLYGKGAAAGRRFTEGTGLQMVWTPLRGAVMRALERQHGDAVADLDIKKCHPTLFVQRCRREGVAAPLDFLNHFLDDPDWFFALAERDAGANRDQAKQLVCMGLNLGTADQWLYKNGLRAAADSELMLEAAGFYQEVLAATSELMELRPELSRLAWDDLEADGDGGDHEMAHRKRFQYLGMNTDETEVVQAALAVVKESPERFSPQGLYFDGLGVRLKGVPPGTPEVAAVTGELCERMAARVFSDTGFSVTFVHKPWDESISLPDDFKRMTDKSAAKTLLNWLHAHGHRVVLHKKSLYLYNADDGLYSRLEKGDGELTRMMDKASSVLGDYAEDATKMKRVESIIGGYCERDDNLISSRLKTNRWRLPFANGVLNLRTGKLGPFSPDYFFTSKLKHRYPTTEEELAAMEPTIKEVRENLVDNIWGCNGDYVLRVAARAVAADMDKLMYFAIARENSGKGVFVAALKAAFGGFIGTANGGHLASNPDGCRGDQSKALSWLYTQADARIMEVNEIKPDVKLDATLIKKLSGGGDTFLARENYGREMEITPQATWLCFCNEPPYITGMKSDPALQARLVAIPMPNQHLQGAEYLARRGEPGVMEAKPWIKDWVSEDDKAAAMAVLVCRAYGPMPDMPEDVKENTQEWIADGEVVDPSGKILHVADVLVKTDSPLDYVTIEDVQREIHLLKKQWMHGKTIGQQINQVFGVTSKTTSYRGKSRKVYRGLRLSSTVGGE